MQPTQKTTAPGYPPYFLTGTNGTSGTALSGAGFSRPGSGTAPGQTGTSKPQRAVTGERLLTRLLARPLFSGAKVASGQPLPGRNFGMIINKKHRPALASARVSVDKWPVSRAVVDNFSRGPVCLPAYLLSDLRKIPEGLPGVPCGQTGAKVMHIGKYA